MENELHGTYILESSGAIDIYSAGQANTTISLEIAPEPPLEVTGRVMDRFSEGKGIENAAVLVYGMDNKPVGKTYTDRDGVYLFTGLPEGRYKLTANHAGYRTAPFAPVTLEARSRAILRIVLPPEETQETLVYGRAATPDGIPLANVRISLTGRGGTIADTVTSAQGEYAVYGLADGAYTLRAGADGYAQRQFETALDSQNRVREINLTLAPVNAPADAAAVSGFVTNTQGAPVAGAWVGLYQAGGGKAGRLAAETSTSSDGFYTFSRVAAGQYMIKSKAMVV